MITKNSFAPFYIALLLLFSAEILANPKCVAVTYIANDGFLIAVNQKLVLIDALFGDQELSFCETPGATQLKQMILGKGKFDDVNLVLTTHNHRDHFHAPFVAEHLLNNLSGKFLSCPQVTAALKENKEYKKIEDRILSVSATETTDTIVSDIHITALPFQHSPYFIEDPQTKQQLNKHRHIQNIGYIIEINGVKIFHSGDSSPKYPKDFSRYQLQNKDIDIAFLDRAFLAKKEYVTLTKTMINPDFIVLMHIHPDNQSVFIDIAAKLDDIFKNIYLFQNQGSTLTVNLSLIEKNN